MFLFTLYGDGATLIQYYVSKQIYYFSLIGLSILIAASASSTTFQVPVEMNKSLKYFLGFSFPSYTYTGILRAQM